MTQPVSIDVVSDVVCPWCYLGKARLEHAIAALPDLAVTVRWRPYQLDPTVPPEGMDRAEYIAKKFGSLDALDDAHKRLADMGEAEGIHYAFDRITRSPNTINAHRLVRFAGEAGNKSDVVTRLFAANFTEGRDVGNLETLADIAGEAGMDRVATLARLQGDEGRAEVLAEIQDAYRIGVSGVPTFILAQRYGVVGAQSVETLTDAIRQVAAKAA
ncbi:MAG TPA: DsbA family oxidoreductase [Bauldia sp.]|nr:DsbA family oxidoreductase [Bauldia sp.]